MPLAPDLRPPNERQPQRETDLAREEALGTQQQDERTRSNRSRWRHVRSRLSHAKALVC